MVSSTSGVVVVAAAAAASALDVGAAFRGGPELAVEHEEAGRFETGGRSEYIEPERRLDHELLRIRTPQDRLGGICAGAEDVPHPFRGDAQEMLPGAATTAEEERGDDEEAGHRFALRVAPLGGRVERLAYPLVGLARVRGRRFFVQGQRERVAGLSRCRCRRRRRCGRGGIKSPSEGLLVQGSEQAHCVAYGLALLHGSDNKRGDGRVR